MIRSLSQPVVVVAAAIACGALVLLATGHDPLLVYRELVSRTVLRQAGIEESLVAMAPVLLAALAAWVAARVGMWNIGIDGQIVAGAVVAGALAPRLGALPVGWMWVIVTVAGMAGGAAWALVPGLLRVRGGVNEIVTTIMMTYVAFSAASWLIKGALQDASMVTPATVILDVSRRVPELGETRVHAGVIVAVVLCGAVWVVSRWTAVGILSRLVGDAPKAARRIGVRVDRYVLGGFLVSGGIAALAGVTEVLAVRGAVQADWRPQIGLAAFAALFLARRAVPGLVPAALLLGALSYASTILPRSTGVAPDFFPFLEGVILVFLAVAHWRRGGVGHRTSRAGEVAP